MARIGHVLAPAVAGEGHRGVEAARDRFRDQGRDVLSGRRPAR
ncbi:hypothetical protein ACU4GR_10965 [Methylobacterium oryzae CBMB20]